MKLIIILTISATAFIVNISTASAAISKPPTNLGLVGYWSFNEGQGVTSTDYSGNKNNGTLTSFQGNPWVNGKLGKALSFDGSNDYVELGDSDSFTFPAGGAGFTVSAWAYKKTAATVGGNIAEKYLFGTGLEWDLGYFSDNTLWFLVYDNTQGASVGRKVTPHPSSNAWHHIVGVYNGGTTNASAKIYVDGVQSDNVNAGDSAFVTMRNTTKTVTIGKGSTLAEIFNGLIDEVRIYNRALSASEVAGLYNSGAVKFQVPNNKGLVGYWSFNEGQGTTSTDFSGNGNKGTLTNFQGNPWVNGKLGKALSFDGSNDYVALPDDVYNSYTRGAITAWIKLTDTTNEVVFGEASNSNSNALAYFRVSSGKLEFIANNNSDVLTGNTVLSNNRWYHVVATSNGSLTSLYVDSVLQTITVSLGSNTGKWFNSSVSGVMRYTFGNLRRSTEDISFLNGLIDEVRIYNRALSAAEVAALYQSGAVKFKNPDNKGLVGYWSFNEGQGTTSTDFSGNKNNGTLTNMQGNPWVNGKLGKALSFDGSNDYVKLGPVDFIDLGTNNWTVSAWLKPDTFTAPRGWLGNEGVPGGGVNDSRLVFNSETGAIILAGENNSTDIFSTVGVIGRWQHIVMVRESSTLARLYIDGVSKETKALASTDEYKWSIIGAFGSTIYFFDGLIDEVRIYNRALSASEVQTLYNSGR